MSNMGNRAFRLPTAFHRRRLFLVEQPAPTEPTDEFGQILKQEPGKERLGKCWPERLIPRLCVFTEAQYIPKMSLGVTLFGTALKEVDGHYGSIQAPAPHLPPSQLGTVETGTLYRGKLEGRQSAGDRPCRCSNLPGKASS